MRKTFLSILAVLLLAAVLLYIGGSWIFANKLLSLPPQPFRSVVFADYGLPEPEELVIQNGSVALAAWYFANPRSGDCAVLMMHGITGNRTEIVSTTPLFWARGCHLLMYDARGHGASTSALPTYGVQEKFDELAALNWLSKRTGLPHAKIGLIGWSFGAATSLQLAPLTPDIAFVIADSSYASLYDIALYRGQVQFGDWTRMFIPGALAIASIRAGFDAYTASPQAAVQDLNIPVLLVHSTTDHFTPYTQSEVIYATSNSAQTVLYLSRWGAPHGMAHKVHPREYTARVDEFLAAKAPGFGATRVALPYQDD